MKRSPLFWSAFDRLKLVSFLIVVMWFVVWWSI